MQWYQWRWSKVFAVSEAATKPMVPDDWSDVLPVEAAGSMRLDELSVRHQARCGDGQGVAPAEVVRLRAFTAGKLSVSLPDRVGDDGVSLGDLVAALHRVRLKTLKMADRYDPLYGELPEGQYLASIRTQFLMDYDPSAEGS